MKKFLDKFSDICKETTVLGIIMLFGIIIISLLNIAELYFPIFYTIFMLITTGIIALIILLSLLGAVFFTIDLVKKKE